MPLSYDFIEKPSQAMLIDRLFSGSADELREAYDYALSILERADSIDETTDELALGDGQLRGFSGGDAEHFREHWLDPDRGRHPWSGPEVGRIMHDAYLDAIEAASRREVPVPIETFWVFSPIEQFEMRVSESAHQISVFLLIPKTPEILFEDDVDQTDESVADRGVIRRFGPEDSSTS